MSGTSEQTEREDEEYRYADAQELNNSLPYEIDTDRGNSSFQSGEVGWETFLDDLSGGEGSVTFGYSRVFGDVSISTRLDGDSAECGSLVSISPDEAREAAEVLEELADLAEQAEMDETPPEDSIRARFRSMLGVGE